MLALRRAATTAQKRLALATPAQTASFSADRFNEKERAAEAAYFNKEDEKSLRQLLKKLKSQADKNDVTGLKSHVEHDKKGLDQLGLKLSPEQVEALLKWKHEH